jgi:hypothetical protein
MSALHNTLYGLRKEALSFLTAQYPNAPFQSTLDPFATARFLANLRPESTESIFSTSHHTAQAEDVKAFEAALHDAGTSAGFGPNTTLGEQHTNLRTRRKPNDDGQSYVKGILLVAQPIKKPTTTTNANTIADDSNDFQTVAPDRDGYVREQVARVWSQDYMPYVQKSSGAKEMLGRANWVASESGQLYCLYSYPEGWRFGGEGQGSELIVGFKRTRLTYNREWVADSDAWFEDIASGMGIAFTGSQPATGTVLATFDIAVHLIGASVASVRP